MAKMWDPKTKKWVDKPEGTTGLVNPQYRTAKVAGNVTIPKWSAEVAGETDVANMGEAGPSLTDKQFRELLGLGGSTGPTRQQSRNWGYAAARGLAQAGQQAQVAAQQRAAQQAAAMRGQYDPMYAQQEAAVRGLRGQSEAAYNPYFTQQQTDIEAQRKAAMDFLAAQYGGNQQAINDATAAALAAIPQTQAYSNVPLVELSQQQNPLLSGLAAYGTGAEGVQAQSAQDAALAAQLAAFQRGAVGQLNTAQQNVRNAALADVNTRQAEALRQLALGRAGAEAGISSTAQQALSGLAGERARLGADLASAESTNLFDLAKARAASNVDVENMRQQMLNDALDKMLSGKDAAAQLRAKTIAEFGPKGKKKSKSKAGK